MSYNYKNSRLCSIFQFFPGYPKSFTRHLFVCPSNNVIWCLNQRIKGYSWIDASILAVEYAQHKNMVNLRLINILIDWFTYKGNSWSWLLIPENRFSWWLCSWILHHLTVFSILVMDLHWATNLRHSSHSTYRRHISVPLTHTGSVSITSRYIVG